MGSALGEHRDISQLKGVRALSCSYVTDLCPLQQSVFALEPAGNGRGNGWVTGQGVISQSGGASLPGAIVVSHLLQTF